MFKLDLEKSEEPEITLPKLLDHTKSKRVHPYGRKQRGTKEPLDESERGE